MSKFELIGQSYQFSSCNSAEAEKRFTKSCDLCCTTGKHIQCDRCAIAIAHNFIIDFFGGK